MGAEAFGDPFQGVDSVHGKLSPRGFSGRVDYIKKRGAFGIRSHKKGGDRFGDRAKDLSPPFLSLLIARFNDQRKLRGTVFEK
jgi:hypothetical protein